MPRPARPKPTSTAKTADPRSLNYSLRAIDAPSARGFDDPRLWSALIVLLTCLAFAPLFVSDFTNIDDLSTIARNPRLNPPTLASLLEFWDPRKPRMDLYVPVTYTVWSAVARLAWLPTADAAGIHLNPWMFHGTNVLLHALSALIVFQILRMLIVYMRAPNAAPAGPAPRTDSAPVRDDPPSRLAAPLAGRGALLFGTPSGPQLINPAGLAPRTAGDWTRATGPAASAPWFRAAPIAAAGALVFALHPVQAEPVGWASGTKDVLYGLLSLIAIWLYLRSVIAPTSDTPDGSGSSHLPATSGPGLPTHNHSPFRCPWYWLGMAAFILAMLSKPTAIVTPLIAVTLDLLVLRRRLRDVVRAIWPWLVLVVPVIMEGRFAQPAHHPGDYVVPLYLRPLIAADALAFYFYKLLWPANLGFIYDRSPQAVISHGWLWWTWVFPAAAAMAALAPLWTGARTAFRLRLRFRSPPRRSASDHKTASGVQASIAGKPAATVLDTPIVNHRFVGATLPLAALAIFAICLLPVLGFVPFDFQQFSTTADHYLYLAMLGPALSVAFVLEGCTARSSPFPGTPREGRAEGADAKFDEMRAGGRAAIQMRPAPHVVPSAILCITLIAALGVRTVFQTRHWHDSFSLLEHSIGVNPASPYLYDNLSKAYADANLPDEARRWDEESVRRWPDRAGGHLNLASDLLSLNRPAEAEAQLEAVIRLDPTCLPAQEQLARLRQHSTTSP